MKISEHLTDTLSTYNVDPSEEKRHDQMGDAHFFTGLRTPMHPDAFKLSKAEKKQIIAKHFKIIMETLGLDLRDDSLQGTPHRVAKMYIDEIFSGLDPRNKPDIALFNNSYQYQEMLVEKDISFYSNCEHHFVPIIGKAHLAYISSGKVIGLSKLNRLVKYYARRPQVQERLTNQIAVDLVQLLDTEDIALIIEAKHLCVSSRGIEDDTSSTTTVYYGGAFKEDAKKLEFQNYLRND